MTNPPPDWDVEMQALRDAATRAGIRPTVDAAALGVELESPDDLLARVKAFDQHDHVARRRRRRRGALIASSVAAAAVLAVGVLQPWAPQRVEASTPAVLDYELAGVDVIADAPGTDPTLVLASLAEAAARRPAPAASTGTQHVVTDNWYAEIEASTGGGSTALIPQITETWLGEDGSLRLVERRDNPLPASGRGLPRDGAWADQPATADETQPAGSVDPDLVENLSTDADTLRDELLALGGCPDAAPSTARSLCLYDQVLALHQTYVVPADLQAAIWQVLVGEEGFRSLGKVEDRAGRAGTGISLIARERPEYRLVLIADPATGSLLGSEQILIRSVPGLDVEAPAVTSFTAILSAERDN